MSENSKKKSKEIKPEDIPLGTGLLDKAKQALLTKKTKNAAMRKRFNIK